jgi:acetolactate synthase small subunit
MNFILQKFSVLDMSENFLCLQLTATNDKLQHELAVLRALNDAANATGNSAELEREVC